MALKGLLTTRQIWVPTLRGWGVISLIGLGLTWGFFRGVHPFLAVNAPAGNDLLVIEGWLSDRDLIKAIQIFQSQNYKHTVTTGLPLSPDSRFVLSYPDLKSIAEIAKARLVEAGLSETFITPVPGPPVARDRTYAGAVELRKWLDQKKYKKVDILSLGTHARRSWLLYRLALGESYQVGIIAQTNRSYDPKRWWASSAGVRIVIGELLAYGYARLLFFPENNS